MKKIMLLSFFALYTNFAQSRTVTLIAEYTSDYLCMLEDPRGFHNDEGLVVSLPVSEDEAPDIRFIDGEWVKYPFTCRMQTTQILYIFDCSFYLVPTYKQHLEINKDTLKASLIVEENGIAKTWNMNCKQNN
jgi:hypothetical protein